MLCSNCSTVIRPIVAIDIDGTLGIYHAHLMRFTEAYMGMKPGELASEQRVGYHGQMPFREWFCSAVGVDLTTFRQIKLAYRQGAQKRSMPAYHGATTLVSALRRDAEVWLTTTRPYLRLDNVDPDTRFWLDQHGIEFDGMLYDEDKYRVLAERVNPDRVVAVLDDLSDQLWAAQDAFGEDVPVVRRTSYNRDTPGINPEWASTINLDEARELIKRRAERWSEVNANVPAAS